MSLFATEIFFQLTLSLSWVHFYRVSNYVIEFAAGWPAALGGANVKTYCMHNFDATRYRMQLSKISLFHSYGTFYTATK